eukprot:TRINITY_DN1738_c0_g1_i3.p2 TRINITY_DN1738_c0_g1~~TRINITY_DN1738_c0_g1_i3.p2  ORF type:complete len:102 (-),score=21.36 TRINITY_DN1738_c0_g1_i3:404-709(-)
MTASATLDRSVAVVAHNDHGKSTLTDSLVTHAGLTNKDRAGKVRWTDGRADEMEKGITIKSAAVTVPYTHSDGSAYAVNVIDTTSPRRCLLRCASATVRSW